MSCYTIKELFLNDLKTNLLDEFNRYQEVKKCWRKIDNEWELKDISFIDQWDENLKKEIVAVDLTNCIKSGGSVWGTFNADNKLIAFTSLLSRFFGSENQYIQLMQIHVSHEYRNQGIGKKMFLICADRAREMGAKKLYISTHSAEESHCFYRSMGCVDVLEINRQIAEHEPCDRQMEYVL